MTKVQLLLRTLAGTKRSTDRRKVEELLSGNRSLGDAFDRLFGKSDGGFSAFIRALEKHVNDDREFNNNIDCDYRSGVARTF